MGATCFLNKPKRLPEDLKDFEADSPDVDLLDAMGLIGGWLVIAVIVAVGLAVS